MSPQLTGADPKSQGHFAANYSAAHLAIDWLVTLAGADRPFDYFRQLVSRGSCRDAFEGVFGALRPDSTGACVSVACKHVRSGRRGRSSAGRAGGRTCGPTLVHPEARVPCLEEAG